MFDDKAPRNASSRDLSTSHTPEAIKARLQATKRRYLRDFVYGAIDGTVTTFAVVCGTVGADLGNRVALILGFANLAADGFSMAASNYLGTRAEVHARDQARRLEERHIDMIPAGETEEVRQIFAAKGFQGDLLEQIVGVITGDRKRWVETMVVEEYGFSTEAPSPLRAASATFLAFALAGFVPLLPLLISGPTSSAQFQAAVWATGGTFVAIGALKGWALTRSKLRSAVETLTLGGFAAALAYLVGIALQAVG